MPEIVFGDGTHRAITTTCAVICTICAVIGLPATLYCAYAAYESRASQPSPSAMTSNSHFDVAFTVMVICYALLFVCALILAALRMAKKRHKPSNREVAVSSTLDSMANDCEKIALESKLGGAQARLLWHFQAEAKDLEQLLLRIWHHWNKEGVALVHPISHTQRDWTDVSKGDWQTCVGELRDFKGLYSSHLVWVGLEFPGLRTAVTQFNYPCELEYHEVMTALKDHAKRLDKYAERAWNTGEPIKELDAKAD